MTEQEIANDKLMHYHAHLCCQILSLESRSTFLFEIGDKYGKDWKEEVMKRVTIKWKKEKAKCQH